MKIEDAKIGQIIIGNEGAECYAKTGPGVKCKIIDIYGSWLRVSLLTPSDCDENVYPVNPAYFDICVNVEDKYTEFKLTKELMQDILKCPEGKVIYVKDDNYSPYTIKNNGVYDKDDCRYSFGYFIYSNENKEYKIDDIPCVEMTLDEVCEALGKNIKIIKGESK